MLRANDQLESPGTPAGYTPAASRARSRLDSRAAPREGRHILTIALEDYYQVGAFNRLIQRGQWYRFETRAEQATLRTLDLLDEYGVRATFFTLGWIADRMPELVRTVADRGHEIASKGYYHYNIRQQSASEFRDDLAHARDALENASGRRVLGYRVADAWFEPSDLWALDVLAEEGYAYDSSICPRLGAYRAEPWRRFAHQHRFGDKALWELPLSSAEVAGYHIPIAGGNWFRQLPQGLVRRAVRHWDRAHAAPYVMYFHTWELDPAQPKIEAAAAYQRLRHYRNLARMGEFVRGYLARYRFTSVADYLGLSTELPVAAVRRRASRPSIRVSAPSPSVAAKGGRTPVSIVLPCHNEELVLPYLSNTLESVEARLSAYDLHFIFVDDCSSDGTWAAMQRIFGNRTTCTLLKHEVNRGVAGSIMTGIRAAKTEIVCSIDSDCSYDPHELANMIPMLGDSYDIVTASPYHPAGNMRNVAAWRLFLSRSLSRLYGLLLNHKLYTYTSCFRVYRRSAALGIELERGGFLGVSEFIAKLDLAGGRLTEYPTTLEGRLLGRSKMKVVRTIIGQVKLLASLAWQKSRGKVAPLARAHAAVSALNAAALWMVNGQI
ncbi:MAG: XrtA system polysaccharide deacetylase [Gemmatimonadaceae bacterium]